VKKNLLMVLNVLMYLILVACGYDSSQEQISPEYNIFEVIDNGYADGNDVPYTDEHPIIGTWLLISYTEYDAHGEFIGDLIDLMIQLGYEERIRMPIIIDNNGTLNWQGVDHSWNIGNGLFRFGSDMGGNYSVEDGNLIIERIEFGYLSRKILQRIE